MGGLDIANVVIASVGATAGVVAVGASLWAVKVTKEGNAAAAADRSKASQQRAASVRPAPQASHVSVISDDCLSLHVSNSGGVATYWYLLVVVGDGVYFGYTDIPAGAIGIEVSRFGRRCGDAKEPLAPGEFRLLTSLARDVDGGLWDLQASKQTDASLVELLNRAGAPWNLTFA